MKRVKHLRRYISVMSLGRVTQMLNPYDIIGRHFLRSVMDFIFRSCYKNCNLDLFAYKVVLH